MSEELPALTTRTCDADSVWVVMAPQIQLTRSKCSADTKHLGRPTSHIEALLCATFFGAAVISQPSVGIQRTGEMKKDLVVDNCASIPAAVSRVTAFPRL